MSPPPGLFIVLYTDAIFHCTIALPASARVKYCSVWTGCKCWLDKAEAATCHFWVEKVWSLLSVCLSNPPPPNLSSVCLLCRWQSLVPKLLSGKASQSSFGFLSSYFSKLSWGAHLARRSLCQVQCGIPPLAAIKRPFVFSSSPSSRMWHTPRKRWKFPHHTTALSRSIELALKANHLEPTEVSPIFILLQEINWVWDFDVNCRLDLGEDHFPLWRWI